MSAVEVDIGADHRPDVYQEGDLWVVRASAIGGCMRSLVAAGQGYRPVPPREAQKLAMEEGVIHEPHILRALENSGWKILSRQEEVELAVGTNIVIRGHTDGFGIPPATDSPPWESGGPETIECKAMSADVFKRYRAHGLGDHFRRYAWQGSVYMHATRRALTFAVKNRNTGEIDIARIKVAPVSLTDIKVRAAQVVSYVKRGEWPACDPVQFPCSFFYLHDERDGPLVGEPVSDDALDALAQAYDDAAEEEKAAKAKRKIAGARLLDALEGRQKIRTRGYTVTEVTRTDVRTDWAKVVADHGIDDDELEAYRTRSEVRYVKVTPAVT